ncbi:MAG: 4Fe-4S binding protein [Lachnoclostridium sp.]|nr:4Fe-4S binding protein [Lachnoclostridium sp.]
MILRLATCFLALAAVAIQQYDSLFGHKLGQRHDNAEAVAVLADSLVINTSVIESDIRGYGGPIPLEITVVDDKIAGIKVLPNAETPDFFGPVERRVIPKWIGVDVTEVADMEVNAVTGATISSDAVNATIKAGIAYSLHQAEKSRSAFPLTAKNLCVLAVILAALVIPLFVRSKRYRYIQLALNVVVLGFWSGTFLSYTLLLNYLSNGVNVIKSLAWLLMIVAAVIYPYFGKKSHYCAWICPLGSIQELAGKCVPYKLPISKRVENGLKIFQNLLWGVLMFLMCAGIYAEWMNYELFTAFIFNQAATGIVIAAVAFVALSFVVNRPYCRFICPTGSLFKVAQNSHK